MVLCPSLTRHRLYRFYLEVIVTVDHYYIMIVINKEHRRVPHNWLSSDRHSKRIRYIFKAKRGLTPFHLVSRSPAVCHRECDVYLVSRVTPHRMSVYVRMITSQSANQRPALLASGQWEHRLWPQLSTYCGHNTPGAVLEDPQEHRYDRHKILRQSPDMDIQMPHTKRLSSRHSSGVSLTKISRDKLGFSKL